MKEKDLDRRRFLATVSAAAGTFSVGTSGFTRAGTIVPSVDDRPALQGGKPVRKQSFPSWPVIEETDRDSWERVLNQKKWNRGPSVDQFEEKWAKTLGARHVVATSSGTSALYSALNALEIGPGDEVVLPPYTFVATLNVVLLNYALPVFVDSDRRSFQIDAEKIEEAISEDTRCVLPVHLGGNVADMDRILRVTSSRGIPVLEDACQSHLAEWRGKKVGTLGDLGCFSFQASKNLNSGEGGAVSGNNDRLMQACKSFHNAGRAYEVDDQGRLQIARGADSGWVRNGDNRRLTEFQGALLLEQLTRLESQARTRETNAAYLSDQLNEIDGISPALMYEGCTRNAYHLYMMRYDDAQFSGLPRSVFIEAMKAEGIPCSGGYEPLNQEAFLKETLRSRPFQKIYGERRISRLLERNQCPENDRLCQEAVWFGQTMLLSSRQDMDQIADAIRKIQRHSGSLARQKS